MCSKQRPDTHKFKRVLADPAKGIFQCTRAAEDDDYDGNDVCARHTARNTNNSATKHTRSV